MKFGLTALLLFILLGLVACGGSVKGKWTEDDKKQFTSILNESLTEKGNPFGDKQAAYVDCCLKKMENNYASFTEAMIVMGDSKDEKAVQDLFTGCTKSLIGGN